MASFDWNNFTVEPFDQEDTSNVALAPPPTEEKKPEEQAQQSGPSPPIPAPSSSPVTFYSQGTKAGGPDPSNDQYTNTGQTATGPNLTEGIVAVDPRVYPLGSILRDEKSGRLFLAGDKHGAADPKTVDVYTDPANYDKATQKSGETRQFSVVGRVDPKDIPKTPEEVTNLLNQVGQSQPKQGGQEIKIIDAVDPNAPYMGKPREASGVRRIIMHGDVSDDVDQLVAYGRKVDPARGFAPGYHFYIGRDGTVKQGAPVDRITNHTLGNNADSIGIIVAGADNGRMPTPAQETAAKNLIAMLGNKYGISPKNVIGHGELQPNRRDPLEGGNIAANVRKYGYGAGGGDSLLPEAGLTGPTGPAAAPAAAPVGHDTAPDGTRPMGEGRYIWPGEKGDPSQPAGEGRYIWPGAQRASPEEIESARYGPFRNPMADTAPPPSDVQIAEASGFPWPKAEPPDVRWAEPVHGYTPSPTPVAGVPYAPSQGVQPQAVTAQYPFEFGIAPPTQQVDQYRYGTGTLPPDYGTQQPAAPAAQPAAPVAAPAVAPTPSQPAAAQLEPRELAKSRNPGEQLTSYLNMFNRGMTSEGILSMIEGLDALALHHLPDWKVLDWLKDNLKSEQKQTAWLRNKLRQDVFPADRATTESKVGQVLQVLGQGVQTVGLGAASGGAGLASSIITGLQAAGQLYDEARQDALQHGATEEQANSTAIQYLAGAGVFEYISDKFLVGRFLHGAGKLTLGQISKEFAKGGALEGVTEPTQQLILNWLAKGKYDPDRPLSQDVLDSAIVGVFGGGIGAGGAHVAGHFVGKAQRRAQQGELQQAAEQLKGVKAEDVGTELTPAEQEAFKKGAPAPVAPTAAPAAATPAYTYVTPEGEAWWNTAEKLQADYFATEPNTPERKAARKAFNDHQEQVYGKGNRFGRIDAEGNVQSAASISLAEQQRPATPEEVKASLAMPEAPATVKVQAFDPKAREFVETEMAPTQELHEQLKREENSYNALIKCLEL